MRSALIAKLINHARRKRQMRPRVAIFIEVYTWL